MSRMELAVIAPSHLLGLGAVAAIERSVPTFSRSSGGMSERKLEGAIDAVEPNTVRCRA